MRSTMIAVALIASSAGAQAVDGYALYTRAPGGSGIYTNGELRLVTVIASVAAGDVHIDDTVRYAQFSPDGTRVAYTRIRSGKSEIILADRDGSNKQVLAGGFTNTDDCPRLCWRQPLSILYAYNKDNKAYALDVSSGAISVFYTSPQALWSFSVDTARRHGNFYTRTITRGIWIVDLQQGSDSESFVDGGCGNWMSPDGTKFTNNLGSHQDMYIRNWNKSVYKTLTTGASNRYWNRQKWSNNSNEWIIYPLGPSYMQDQWSQAWAYNFETGTRLQLTSQTTYNDNPKDFWLGSASPPPNIISPASGDDLVEGSAVTLQGQGSGTLTWSYDANSDGQGRIDIGAGANVSFTVPTGVGSPREIEIFLMGEGGEVSVLCNIVSGAADPVISLNPTSLVFSATQGGSDPSDETVSVTNSGGGTLSFVSVSESASWLTVGRSGSGNNQTLTNSVDISGLSPDTYAATVTVSGGGATSSDSYTVTLTVAGPPVLAVVALDPAGAQVEPSGSATFTARATDQNGDAFATVISWSVSGGGAMSPVSSGSAVSEHSSSFSSDGTEGTFTVTASSGSVSGTATVTVSTTPALHLKINCGDNTVAGWEVDDPYVSGGGDYTFSTTIDVSGVANAAPSEVYKTCRRDGPSFSFPAVANGTYTVRLHFADQFAADRRAIDVTIEGVLVVDDLDISGEAGSSRALVKTASVTVSDGDGMQIELYNDGGIDAFIGGIEIIGGGGPANQPPSATCSASPTWGEAPLDVGFTGGGTDPDGWIQSYFWGFGDGATSSAQNPNHVYESSGIYTATLTATDNDGATATASVEITVAEPAPSITVIAPDAGEVWYVGTTRHIRWSTVNLNDVVISYRTSPGGSWTLISWSVDTGSPYWGDYPWEVPDEPSTECIVRIQGYFGEAPTDSAEFEIAQDTDSDGDGMDDDWERAVFGDLTHDQTTDADGDGATDYEEYVSGTDPLVPDGVTDSDSDGMDDDWEIRYFGDLTHDGTVDTDGDGFTDLEEFMRDSDPTAADGGGGTGLSCAPPASRQRSRAAAPWMLVLAALSLLRRAQGGAAAVARTASA